MDMGWATLPILVMFIIGNALVSFIIDGSLHNETFASTDSIETR